MGNICGSLFITIGMLILGIGMQLVTDKELQGKIYNQLRKTFKDAFGL